MRLNEYQAEAGRSAAWRRGDDYPLNMTALGICEEAGEVAAVIRKANRAGATPSTDALVDELGDVLWGVTQMASILGVPLEAIAAANIAKQRRRHPARYADQ